MKHLRETFTDQEFQDLKDAKERIGATWHDFILLLSHISLTEALVTRLMYPIRENVVKPPEEVKTK